MRKPLVAVVTTVLIFGLVPAAAHAEFGIAPGNFTLQMLDSAGNPETRAGIPPDRFRMSMAFNQTPEGADGNLKDLTTQLPSGFVGNPNAVAICPREVAAIVNQDSVCPPESQVGTVSVEVGATGTIDAPIFNTEPLPGDLAEFSFKVFVVSGRLIVRLAPDGRGTAIEMTRAVQDLPLKSMTVELWGIPADHQTGSTATRNAFLTAPTRCDRPLMATARARSWEEPEVWRSATSGIGTLTGCEGLSFQPQLGFALDSAAADSPTGARIELTVPQSDDPDGTASDRVKDATVQMPDGVALSPAAASGLEACGEGAAHVGEAIPASCPPASKIGTVEMATPLLDAPIEGAVFMGGQLPGTDYRMFVVLAAPGIDIKIPVTLHADPVTGRLTTRMADLPQMPFDRLTLRLMGGARAPLVSSLTCGTRVASATFVPYGGGSSVASSDVVTTSTGPSGGPCPASLPFAPAFVAGTTKARAGKASPLSVTIRRRDGEQPLDSFSVKLPRGLAARLAAVKPCPAAAVAAVRCPLTSKVGSIAVEAGSGPNPLPLRGEAFLTGRHKDAPFGLMFAIPGIAGPFDLGTIPVRAGLSLDVHTGQVTVSSDPMPRIAGGIPLRMQTVAIDMDRPGFTLNPTSCDPATIAADIKPTTGPVLRRKSRFAVGGCDALGFRPSLAVELTDRSEFHKNGHPGLRMRIHTRQGDSNVSQMKVALPKLLAASATGPSAICSRRQAIEDRCPRAAKIGDAATRTPLLSDPLKGPVYLVQPRGGGLPDVWSLLHGEGASVEFRMKVKVKGGQVRGTVVGLPDMALSVFTLTLASGNKGMFATTGSPCVRGHVRRMFVTADMTAHSGATHSVKPRVRTKPRC